MANRNTKRFRDSKDERNTYGRKTGICINSSEARKQSGKKPYDAPTRKKQ